MQLSAGSKKFPLAGPMTMLGTLIDRPGGLANLLCPPPVDGQTHVGVWSECVLGIQQPDAMPRGLVAIGKEHPTR